MHYENIAKLLSRLDRTFESQAYVNAALSLTKEADCKGGCSFFWASGPVVLCKQKGAFRVNCIDCLDRTNVVMVSATPLLTGQKTDSIIQSAFARHVLNSQLEAIALIHHHSDAKSSEMENVVNDRKLGIGISSILDADDIA